VAIFVSIRGALMRLAVPVGRKILPLA